MRTDLNPCAFTKSITSRVVLVPCHAVSAPRPVPVASRVLPRFHPGYISRASSADLRKVYSTSGFTTLPVCITAIRAKAPLRLANIVPVRSSPSFFSHATRNSDDLLLPDVRSTVSQSLSLRTKAVPPTTVNDAVPPSTVNDIPVVEMSNVPLLPAKGLGSSSSLHDDRANVIMANAAVRNIYSLFMCAIIF